MIDSDNPKFDNNWSENYQKIEISTDFHNAGKCLTNHTYWKDTSLLFIASRKHGCCQTGEAYKVKDPVAKSNFAKTNGKGHPPNSNGGNININKKKCIDVASGIL